MSTLQRPTLTVRDELALPSAPGAESGLIGWVRDFLTAFGRGFRTHNHLFPACIGDELASKTYVTANKPTAASVKPGTIIFVSDGGAGAVFQGSTGAAWVNLG